MNITQTGYKSTNKVDIIELMLGSADETGDRLSLTEIREEAKTFLTAGHDVSF